MRIIAIFGVPSVKPKGQKGFYPFLALALSNLLTDVQPDPPEQSIRRSCTSWGRLRVLQKDYYQMLGLNRNASEDEIKRAYRKLALQLHPDHHPDDLESEEKFKKISEAYSVLSNPEKKKEYDQFGHTGFKRRYTTEDIFSDVNFEELFREFAFGFSNQVFREFFCRKRGRGCGQRRAKFLRRRFIQQFLKDSSEKEKEDEIYELPLTAREALWGTEKQIIVDSIGEQRKFFIQIPRGVRPGTLFRVVLNESNDGEILLRVRII
jgi:curved DNA-binding protein